MAKQTRPPSRGRAVFVVVAIGVIAFLLFHHSSTAKANIKASVAHVVAMNSNTVRVYVIWHNAGKGAGAANCTMETTVINGLGDDVNVETNTTNTNGSLQPGQTQHLYQDIGVNSGDAAYITPSDVKLSC